jgi:di/tricarboxylate transporter
MTWHRDTGSVIREFSLVASSPEYYSEGEAKQPSDQLAHLLPGSTGFSSRQQSLPLTVGTVLLVEAPNSWVWAHRATSAFAHLKRITDAAAETTAAGVRRPFWPPKKADVIKKLRVAACLSALVTLLCLSAFEIVDLFPLALAISAGFIFIGAMTLDQAWRAINYRVLLVVACSFGPGKALTNTGLAKFAGVALQSMTALGNFGFLFMIVLFSSLLTSIVSNSTAVITLYAILRTMKVPGVSMEAMMCCMMLGGSTDYITPIGYQTNLMVYKRGGYAFADYTKVGLGLTILECAVYAGMANIVL